MDVVKTLVSGVVIIGLATTIGMRGGGISTAAQGAGKATSGVLGTAIRGWPLLALGKNAGSGIAVLVSAGIVFEIIAYCCSSPQTTEMNALTRAPTLMKWVHIGQAQSAVFITFAAAIDKQHRGAIILGGGMAMGISEVLYLHAKQAGLANPGQPTEQHNGQVQAQESYGYAYQVTYAA